MPESPSDVPAPPVFAQPWAIRFGAALLAVFVLMVGFAFLDRARRPQLESAEETTAVGDLSFWKLPDGASLPVVAVTLDGHSLSVEKAQPFEIRDTHTRRTGRDAASGLTVYELNAAATDAEKSRTGGGRAFLLKTAANLYVTAREAGAK
jgi:hypothetical protein